MSGLRTVLVLLLLAVIAVASPDAAVAAPASLIHSSVKLRVDSPNEHAWGTGTIIDARQSPDSPTGREALILTCGHIFRESQGEGHVEVHLYSENSTVRVYGRCLFYDLEIDLALVAIAPPGPVRAVPIAPEGYRIHPHQQVWSVGCDHGSNPTVRTHQIMSVDRVSTSGTRVPFHYVQVSGAPVGGRSGGGLFTAEGYLIGVCNTACPTVNDGHFVPPHVIRHILNERGLAFVHQNPSLGIELASARAGGISPPVGASLTGGLATGGLTPPAHALTALAPLTPLAPIEMPQAMAAAPAPMLAEHRTGMSREEEATLEEINRRKQDGDEVIVIIRSRRNTEIPSDVIVMNGTSNQFLDALVNNPSQSASPAYNPVIFSSHTAEQPTRQPVSFPVRY